MAIETEDVEEIRRRMAQIRRELHEDVREVVAGAEAATDWHRYIRNFPWIAVGVAAGLGYLIVPRRSRRVPADLATHADVAQVREAVVEGTKKEVKKTERKGLVAMGLALLGPVALRAVQSYAAQYLENWIALQQQQMMAAGPPPSGPGSARMPGGPGGRPGGTAGF